MVPTRPLALLVSALTAALAAGESLPLLNPGAEINDGIDRSAVSAPAFLGWDGVGQAINDRTDYGNGGWRLSFEDSAEVFQLTPHLIQPGASYGLRFDAAMFAGAIPGTDFTPDLTLIGGTILNGDFNGDTDPADARSFADTPSWTNLGGDQSTQATRTAPAGTSLDGSRNAVVADSTTTPRQFGIDTGHTLAPGEIFQVTYQWRDASGWDDANDRIRVTLFTTADDTLDGTRTDLEALSSDPATLDSTYETQVSLFAPIPAAANGKRLFLVFEGVDGNANTGGFARLDNFTLQRGTPGGGAPPRAVIADLYVPNGGARQVVATRTFPFKTPTVGAWDHYHLAVPPGALDAFAGQALGIQFRSNDGGPENFQSIDNVRLDAWPSGAPDGSFSDDWNATPNQVWAGPGYWANRLHDWRVNNGRVNCILGGRDRRTLHRTGTTIRGNGAGFSLSVRTGLNAGTNASNAKTGFLLGAGPNLDWRGALLVHDGLGRDFGTFLGLRSDGAAVIDDLSGGGVTPIASGAAPAGGFPAEARLDLDATYNPAGGTYTLTLSSFDPGNTLLTTATTEVPSDRVLGSFGLLSHRGSNDARFWFDDFSGTGGALHPEPDRHLAILGAMHTLSRGTLKITAQLSPLSLAGNPLVTLDTWNGASWDQVATAPIDTTDGVSSYTATFRMPGWPDGADTDYRLGITIGGTTYHWNGTVRRDPVDQPTIVVANTTCQRLNDAPLQNDGVDWSPVDIWQPHTLAYGHIGKHDPDVLLAVGDQIYEGRPTPTDNSSDFNRHHDYLYKWFLWVLQVRDLTRHIPTICIPDDHDIFQGNLWGEGGIPTGNQNTGGYLRPASWVKMVERTQTSNLPDPDPYNPVQPAPPVAQGIEVYFTGMVYGRVGFSILEDRKFKTGSSSPPADPAQQFLLGDRQHDFLRAWTTDWSGQDLKMTVSQSPLGNLHTHAGAGYGFNLNDRDTNGWPAHRRIEAWELLRLSRMFQVAGDQHLATVAHHGTVAPRDAGFSFTAPAISNFFPRAWDPVHDAGGKTGTVSPYLGDFFFNGNGTLPGGEPNLTSDFPNHLRVIAAANPLEYHNRTRNIDPPNLHDRGAGYGLIRIDKLTRRIVFECWPLHADPEYPGTGTQFPDWPVTIAQTDNDGRIPTGWLDPIDTHWRTNPVIRVYDESTGELVYAIRSRGNLFRPPAYDNGTTYRVELSYDDDPVSEVFPGQAPAAAGAPAIHSFRSLRPAVIAGRPATLRWDVASASTLSIDEGIGDVTAFTVDGIGFLEVTPAADTTYTLTLDGSIVAEATVRVFPDRGTWDDLHFTLPERLDPLVSGDEADPDGDGFTNAEEFRFQTDPRAAGSAPVLAGRFVDDGGARYLEFTTSVPVDSAGCAVGMESSLDLAGWSPLPANSSIETGRDNFPAHGTPQVTTRLVDPLPGAAAAQFFRAFWLLE